MKELKAVFFDFYSGEEIGQAKDILSKELLKLNIPGWVKPPKSRENDRKMKDNDMTMIMIENDTMILKLRQ